MSNEPKSRRTTHSRLSVPLRDPRKRDAIVAGGVGVAMLVIVALYAASFSKNDAFKNTGDDLPRWGVISHDLYDAVEPALTGLDETRTQLTAVLDAKMTQSESIEIMKRKIESASGTPEPTPQN